MLTEGWRSCRPVLICLVRIIIGCLLTPGPCLGKINKYSMSEWYRNVLRTKKYGMVIRRLFKNNETEKLSYWAQHFKNWHQLHCNCYNINISVKIWNIHIQMWHYSHTLCFGISSPDLSSDFVTKNGRTLHFNGRLHDKFFSFCQSTPSAFFLNVLQVCVTNIRTTLEFRTCTKISI
jgi:hypothetical protein